MKKIQTVFILSVCLILMLGCQDREITVKEYETGLFVVKLNTKFLGNRIEPFVTEGLATNRLIFEESGAQLAVNAGFFDPKNTKTTSYIIKNGKIIANPNDNENLQNNPQLKANMDKILNRTELRISDCEGKEKFDITPHFAEIESNCTLRHSIQAGPMLYPNLRLEEEFFVVKDEDGKVTRDSIQALKPVARTALGIKNNDIYLIIATNAHPMSLEQLALFCEHLGLEKAMNFDGGGSTSLNFEDFEIISDKNQTARKLKSFLLVMP